MKEKPVAVLAYPKIDHEKNYVYSWVPFSLLLIAQAILEHSQTEVVIFDGNESNIQEWKQLLEANHGRICCIGFSVMSGGGQIKHARELARVAQVLCPDVVRVFGGPHVNVLPVQTLQDPLVDIVLTGPGQRSFPALLEGLSGSRPIESVPGLMMKAEGRVLSGPQNRPRAEMLGRFPWHLLEMENYVRDDPTISSRTLNYVSSQGCIYRCQFCYELTYQRKYSFVSAEAMLNDIDYLVESYGVSGIKFYDADWFINLKRASAFCDGLNVRPYNIKWAASINPNDVLRARARAPRLMEKVAQSGCTRLLMGVESGSDRVLQDIVSKDVTSAQIQSVAEEIASYGIVGSYTFIIGFPGETREETIQTVEFAESLRHLCPTPETRIHVFAPYPGTPLFNAALRNGFSPPSCFADWSRYDYYDTMTPWTDVETVSMATEHTKMRLMPEQSN